MGVVSVSTTTIKPDRFEDYLDQVGKWKTAVEKAGGKNVRLLAALVAGEATGSLAFIVETDDFSAFGASWDKFLANAEGSAQLSTLNTTAGPIASYQTTLWVDVRSESRVPSAAGSG